MATILDTIAEYAKQRVEEDKKQISLDEMKAMALALPNDNPFAFEKGLSMEGIHFICECKKASPSKG